LREGEAEGEIHPARGVKVRSSDEARRLREGSPGIPEALARGSFVWVSARVGNDVSGYVCDRDDSGLLLDVRDASGSPSGYEFLPWASIERVRIHDE
jgi:hypothetical protein